MTIILTATSGEYLFRGKEQKKEGEKVKNDVLVCFKNFCEDNLCNEKVIQKTKLILIQPLNRHIIIFWSEAAAINGALRVIC